MVKFITTFYDLISTSLLYYKYILQGFLIYNFLPANIALLATVKRIWKGTDHSSINEIFKANMKKYDHKKIQSFCMSIPIIILYSTLFILQNEYNENINLILLLILFYLLFLHIIVLTLYSYLAMENNYGFKNTFLIALYLSIKKLWVSISIIVLIVLFYQLAIYNFLLFLFLAPFSYALAINVLLVAIDTHAIQKKHGSF
ncbi:putative membrane protein YesL [Natronobacillus azotifigens]|uniref:DUF624 domain-containing protein n=1 Tax=Natronobacillus azotifigens TaxID=472978 RepID=A0A9J6RD05_9BACI|nr:hypothetical protein [Natronobacillus azotifigens]MCZ0703097.1 hypothetical protein [Natronobacillus azotifigens]